MDTKTVSSKSEKPARGSQRYKRIRTAMMLSGISIFAQLYLFQPLLPALSRSFSLSPAMSSLAVSAGTAGMALGLFTLAFHADRLSRKKLMVLSMMGSAVLTIASAAAPGFGILVFLNFAKGAVISGMSAVALAYISEEVEVSVLGLIISLYLSGNTLGGMSGRVFAGLFEGWFGWRLATFVLGLAGLALAFAFKNLLPESHHFKPQNVRSGYKFRQMTVFMRNPLLLSVFAIAALMMGVFVSVYNYLNFRLEAPPFSLPHYIIASVFLVYIAGIAGSVLAGRWSEYTRPSQILKWLLVTFIGGTLMLLATRLWLFIVGLAIITFSFFGAHTMASRIVSERVFSGKSTATSMYWLFYYMGSSVIGTLMGLAIPTLGWNIFVLILLGLLIMSLACASLIPGYK